ncbi:hypothetical protein CSC2_09260 [Clostridium zeae]|uniref:Uncharacterized protein n=1 Tax=Clostridium zeae TaxID=2759022 RepID=A0ABQ1E6L3_9CLOT|nr:hypothetical protein [Clostridium zeae]GFZ30400.1 hypothetical protein CSC2_09260 [Clostridium zeae]
MNIRLTKGASVPNIKLNDEISLNEYEKLTSRWTEILSIVHEEILKYINDDSLCFVDEDELFPTRSKLTGNYYIDNVSYIKRLIPLGFQIMVSTVLTEFLRDKEDGYLGLEITLFTKSEIDIFEVWGIDSSSI